MFNQIRKIGSDKSGQSTVFVAIAMIVLLGFAAFAVDIGSVAHKKSVLQNAADSAALAGAQDLPTAGTAKNTAKSYALKNGVELSKTTATAPYNGNSKQIEVVCSDTVTYGFARILGFADTVVYARAVAENESGWDGEALPYINLDDDYVTNPEIVAWEKVNPGDFESIDNYEIMNKEDRDSLYFEIDYMNGVELKKGTVATIKQEVGYVYQQHLPDKPVYVISLNRNVILSGKVKLTDGSFKNLNKLKNGDIVDPSQLVLLECIFHDYDYTGKTLFLTVMNVYDIANNVFPLDYVNPAGGSSKLID